MLCYVRLGECNHRGQTKLVFGVGLFRSVEVDFWRPTLRSILDRPTENDFFREKRPKMGQN